MAAMCQTPRERKSKSLDKGRSVEREKEKQKRKERKGKKGQKGKNGEVIGVRSSTFSLRSTKIGPSAFIGARGKVHLRDENFT